MERREFLKLTAGFAAAAGAIAATASAAQAAPAPLPQGDAGKTTDPHEASASTEADKLEKAHDGEVAAADGDSELSARRWWRRRRVYFRRRRRVFWRRRRRFWRRRRVFY